MKKITLAAVILCVLLLFSCNNEEAGIGGESDMATDAAASEYIVLAEKEGESAVIIRPDVASDIIIDAAVNLRRSLESKYGIDFALQTDWLPPGKSPESDTVEIVVGVTNRSEEENDLRARSFRIAAKDNRVFVYGSSDIMTQNAVEYLLGEESPLLFEDGTLKIPADTDILITLELNAGNIPDYEWGKFVGIFEGSDGTFTTVYEDTTAEEYRKYLQLLEDSGFTLYASNTINEVNLYATYTSDTRTLNVWYTDANRKVKIVSDPKGPLPGKEEDNVYERLVDSQLTMIDLETVAVYEGMSFVIRLADGSFIIIDGGFADNDGVEATKLLNVLKEQNVVGDKPRIAAWIFTHLHGDHIGTFNDFVRRYYDEVIIEQIICNFPSDEDIAASDSPYMLDNTVSRYTVFRENREKIFSEVPIIKAHSGQRYYIRNATIEILCTIEDIYPRTIVTDGMNASSLIFSMDIEGQRIMWLGDSATITSNTVSELFGEFLKSDMMQVAHHGYGGGTAQLYNLINPEIVLWPVAQESYADVITYDHNKAFINNDNVKQILVSGFATRTIPLPYDPGAEGEYERVPRR